MCQKEKVEIVKRKSIIIVLLCVTNYNYHYYCYLCCQVVFHFVILSFNFINLGTIGKISKVSGLHLLN